LRSKLVVRWKLDIFCEAREDMKTNPLLRKSYQDIVNYEPDAEELGDG